MVPGGNPVMDTPGLLTATFPVTVVAPVLVTVEPPKMATFSAAPREITEAGAGQELASSPKTINAGANTAADQQGYFFCAELFRMRQIEAAPVLHMGAASTCFLRRKLLEPVLLRLERLVLLRIAS
jgi:hypothetical protein